MTTVNGEFGWRFPPTNGGRVDGFNDPGIAHFSGSPYSSLARETIQNSLDARDSYDEPVHVSFEMIELSPDELGQAELSAAIEACGNEVDSDDPAQSELIRAQEVLALNEVPFLRVSDRNTTGLRGKHWRTLVKMQGASFKADLEGARVVNVTASANGRPAKRPIPRKPLSMPIRLLPRPIGTS